MNNRHYEVPQHDAEIINGEPHARAVFPNGSFHYPLRDSYDISVEESTQNLNNRGFNDVTLGGTANNTVIISGDATERSPGNIVKKADRISITQRSDGFAQLGTTGVYVVESVQYDEANDHTEITIENDLEENNEGSDNDFKLISQVTEFQRVETWKCSLTVFGFATNIEPVFRNQFVYKNGFLYTLRDSDRDNDGDLVHIMPEGPVLLKNMNITDHPSGQSTITFTYERRSETIRLTFDEFELS